MKSATLALGIALIVLGIAGYALTGAVSVTALIPAFFGIPLALLSLGIETKPTLSIVAPVLALAGLGGSAPGLAKIGLLIDGTAENPAAVISQSIMAVLSIVYVVAWLRARGKSRTPAAA